MLGTLKSLSHKMQEGPKCKAEMHGNEQDMSNTSCVKHSQLIQRQSSSEVHVGYHREYKYQGKIIREKYSEQENETQGSCIVPLTHRAFFLPYS